MLYLLDPKLIKGTQGLSLTFGKVEKKTTAAFWLNRYSDARGTDIPDWERRVSILTKTAPQHFTCTPR